MSAIHIRQCIPVTTLVSALVARVTTQKTDKGVFVPVTADAIFSGITTFAKLPWVQCLTKEKDVPFDIAFLGAPFVSLLLSYHVRTVAEV